MKAVRRRNNVGVEPIDQQTSAEIVQIDAAQDPCFLGQNVRSNKLTIRVEYSGRGNRWTTFFRYPDVGNAPVLHTLLGADESADVRESHRLKPRGFPDDVCDRSLHEDSYTVDDEASTSDIGDVLDDVRFYSRADADSWVDAGNSKYIARRYKVTDPDAYGKSHADLDELQGLIALASDYEIESLHLFRSVVSAMKSLEADGHKTRIVYWFSES